MRCRTEGAWVICPEEEGKSIQLVRVFETWHSVEDYKLIESCVPMDGSIQAFDEVGICWYERYGGVFTGYETVEKFVEEIFRFDPVRGCWYVAGGVTPQLLWPIALDDFYELEDMGASWCEALARILAAIPGGVRGPAPSRVPRPLAHPFLKWCEKVAPLLADAPVRGSASFQQVVCECAEPRSR